MICIEVVLFKVSIIKAIATVFRVQRFVTGILQRTNFEDERRSFVSTQLVSITNAVVVKDKY